LSEPMAFGDRIVKKALEAGFNECAVLLNNIERTMVRIANNQVVVTQNWVSGKASLYLSAKERVFQLSFDTINIDHIERTIKELALGIDRTERSFLYAPLPDPDPSARPLEGGFDQKVYDMLENPSEVSEILINTALGEGAERVAGVIDLGVEERCLITSKGFSRCERKTFFISHLRSFVSEGSGHWGYGSRFYDAREVEDVARRSAEYARLSRTQRSVEPGLYDMVLSPMVLGELLESVARGFSALSYILGLSFLRGKKPGDKVASDVLTLKDNPLKHDLLGSSGFDDEGIATRVNTLIERGVFKTLLHNTKTASHMGVGSTGNAGWIYPRPWSLTIEPGDMGDDELVRELKRGLIITNNWYTRFHNYVEGVFSTVSRDALLIVENGDIVGAAKKVRITDTLPNLLSRISAVGRTLYKVKWWEIGVPVEIPFVLVRGLRISS
jgi:PmbA protein